jgi:hypothetical protein
MEKPNSQLNVSTTSGHPRSELESLMQWRARAARRRRNRSLRLAAICVVAAGFAMLGALLAKTGIVPILTAWRQLDAIQGEAPTVAPRQRASREAPEQNLDEAAGDDSGRWSRARDPETAAPRADVDVTPRPTSSSPASDPPAQPSAPDQPLSSRPSPANLTADDVTYQSADRLATIRKGDPKERVFDVFSTVFVKQRGKVMKVEGIRLRASGRSQRDGAVEVGEVVLADHEAVGTPYWFLFEDGRLLAWGRPEEWRAAAVRYQIEANYPGRSGPGENSH